MRVELFGGLEIVDNETRPLGIPSRKARALIAIVCLSPGLSTSRDRLVGLLWSDRADKQARNSLRQTLVALRRLFRERDIDAVETDRDRVCMRPDRVHVDALEFTRLLNAGQAPEAADLYAGPLLRDFSVPDSAFEEWLSDERRRFHDLACVACQKTVEGAAGTDRLMAARRLVELDPLREESHRLLMSALVAAGEREAALRQYELCRETLRTELAVEPEEATRSLREQVARPDGPGAAQPQPPIPVRETTAIAVLPFASLSPGIEHDFFADGVTEDLITELARYRHLSVVGFRVSSRFRDRPMSAMEIGRELGADFLIEGSIRVAEARVRVVVRLVEVTTGETVWADRLDRSMADMFSVQDDILLAVIARLAFNLDEAAARQRQQGSRASGSAYTCFLKARAAWRAGDAPKAMACVDEALAVDAGYARGHAYKAYFHAWNLFSQWAEPDEAETLALSRASIDRALHLDRTDPFVLQRAAMTNLMIGRTEAATRCAEAAARVSACDSEILIIRGLVLACCGDPAQGVSLLERAIELEVGLPPGCASALAEGRHVNRDYAGSLDVLDGIVNAPWYVGLLRAVNLARLGRTAEARRLVHAVPAGIDAARFARSEARMCALPEDADHWKESFRLAGVEV